MGCSNSKVIGRTVDKLHQLLAQRKKILSLNQKTKVKQIILSDEELMGLSIAWENLRADSVESGLFILAHFFELYPETVYRFDFTKDMYGNAMPDFMKSQRMREHSVKVMGALDAGQYIIIHFSKNLGNNQNIGYTTNFIFF